MKEKEKNNHEDGSPQHSLEKILQVEIEVAEKISSAKENAEKSIEAVQEEIVSLKNNIIEQARSDREEILTSGIAVAKEDAQKRIDQARIESEKFEKSGGKFNEEAIQKIEEIILGEFKGEEE
jgi:vacuolar-type H+-ATPase subunit H